MLSKLTLRQWVLCYFIISLGLIVFAFIVFSGIRQFKAKGIPFAPTQRQRFASLIGNYYGVPYRYTIVKEYIYTDSVVIVLKSAELPKKAFYSEYIKQ